MKETVKLELNLRAVDQIELGIVTINADIPVCPVLVTPAASLLHPLFAHCWIPIPWHLIS